MSVTLHCGDNLPWMRTLAEGCCDLIYADPPFFTRRVRGPASVSQVSGRKTAPLQPAHGAKRNGSPLCSGSYDDRWPNGLDSYLQFLEPRLVEMHRLLSPRGSLYVHVDWRVTHHVRLHLDRLFGSDHFLNEIIWSYRTGGRSRRWFARKHDTLLLYAKDPERHIFHVLRDGTFRTEGLNVDASGRPYKNTRNGRLYFHPEGPAMTDVWEIPFLSTVSLERTGYPSQKPEALLDRVVRAGSGPESTVADFFCGSGTTLVAAARLGRRVIGCDLNPEAIELTGRRLAALQGIQLDLTDVGNGATVPGEKGDTTHPRRDYWQLKPCFT